MTTYAFPEPIPTGVSCAHCTDPVVATGSVRVAGMVLTGAQAYRWEHARTARAADDEHAADRTFCVLRGNLRGYTTAWPADVLRAVAQAEKAMAAREATADAESGRVTR